MWWRMKELSMCGGFQIQTDKMVDKQQRKAVVRHIHLIHSLILLLPAKKGMHKAKQKTNQMSNIIVVTPWSWNPQIISQSNKTGSWIMTTRWRTPTSTHMLSLLVLQNIFFWPKVWAGHHPGFEWPAVICWQITQLQSRFFLRLNAKRRYLWWYEHFTQGGDPEDHPQCSWWELWHVWGECLTA